MDSNQIEQSPVSSKKNDYDKGERERERARERESEVKQLSNEHGRLANREIINSVCVLYHIKIYGHTAERWCTST